EHTVYMTWDYLYIEPYVKKGIQTLKDAGFEGEEIVCYCLAGFNTTHQQDFHKATTLWNDWGVRPFIMRYNLRKDDSFLNAWARYWNRGPASYRNHSFYEYCEQRAPALLDEVKTLIGVNVRRWREHG